VLVNGVARETMLPLGYKVKIIQGVWVFRIVAFIGLVFSIVACSDSSPPVGGKLKAGILPDQTAERLHEEFQPLINYLMEETGEPIELVVPQDYQELLTLFANGDIDMAFFGGLTFLQAQSQSGAVPLVARDIDTRFTSLFIARQDSVGDKVTNFGGKRFGFGSNLSTSGHLMPRYFLKTLGLHPEYFFGSVEYTGAHDKTGFAVLDGTLDIGVANTQVIRGLLKSGQLGDGDIKILWETPPYTDYVWAVQSTINPTTKEKLLDAFLALSKIDEQQRHILEKQGAKSFLPVQEEDFTKLRELAVELGLL